MPKRSFVGIVVSDRMQKTAVVAVAMPKIHPLYQKRYYHTRRFKAHNEIGAKADDRVRIVESRPLSKGKRWRVTEVLD